MSFKAITSLIFVTLLSTSWASWANSDRDVTQHEQLFMEFLHEYKIQGNCPTVFVTSRKTPLPQFLSQKHNSYGVCLVGNNRNYCDLTKQCSNQIIDVIEPFPNLDNYLSGVSRA
jgi:hypothetical protein